MDTQSATGTQPVKPVSLSSQLDKIRTEKLLVVKDSSQFVDHDHSTQPTARPTARRCDMPDRRGQRAGNVKPLPSLPPAIPKGERHDDFCCNGCLAAYQLIHSRGLNSTMHMRDRLTGIPSDSVFASSHRGREGYAAAADAAPVPQSIETATSNSLGSEPPSPRSGNRLSVPDGLLRESFVDLDAPRFWQQHVMALPDGRVQATLRLQEFTVRHVYAS